MAVSTRRTNGSPSLSPRPPPIRTAWTSTRLTAEAMAAPRASMARSISSWASGSPASRAAFQTPLVIRGGAGAPGWPAARSGGRRPRPPGRALQGDPAGVGLHAAAAAAGAQLAAVDHHHVADLAGGPVGAGPQPAPEDEGAAHPDPAKTVSRSSKPRPAPRRCSARVATTTSLSTTTRSTPTASATIAPSGTRSPPPKTLAAPNSSPVAASTRPGSRSRSRPACAARPWRPWPPP